MRIIIKDNLFSISHMKSDYRYLDDTPCCRGGGGGGIYLRLTGEAPPPTPTMGRPPRPPLAPPVTWTGWRLLRLAVEELRDWVETLRSLPGPPPTPIRNPGE